MLYDYDPQGPEELLLHEGEIVSVVSDSEDPWWEGVSKGKQGMFPRYAQGQFVAEPLRRKNIFFSCSNFVERI